MKNDVAQIREMGFAGVVIGMLDDEGHIDSCPDARGDEIKR